MVPAPERRAHVMQCTFAIRAPRETGLNLLRPSGNAMDRRSGFPITPARSTPGLAAAAWARTRSKCMCVQRECFGRMCRLRSLLPSCASLPRKACDLFAGAGSSCGERSTCSEANRCAPFFTKSVVACSALPAGRVLSANDLAVKKPAPESPPIACMKWWAGASASGEAAISCRNQTCGPGASKR